MVAAGKIIPICEQGLGVGPDPTWPESSGLSLLLPYRSVLGVIQVRGNIATAGRGFHKSTLAILSVLSGIYVLGTRLVYSPTSCTLQFLSISLPAEG